MEVTNPPMTTVANSAEIRPESDEAKLAKGIRAKAVVTAVIKIGRNRTLPASINASWTP